MKKPDKDFNELNISFEIAELITRYLKGAVSADEEKRLNSWINENEAHQIFWERIKDPAYLEKKLEYWKGRGSKSYWKGLNGVLSNKPNKHKLLLRKTLRYAAVVFPFLLALGAGWYFLKQNKGKEAIVKTNIETDSVQIYPKGKVARLVMGNGAVVQLTDSLKEIIKGNEGTKVSNRGSTLHYLINRQADGSKVVYNTLITPRGGEYQLVLADGTKVWLNAASSLRYPTTFSGEKREVYLTGEAYFEVAPLTPKGELRKPFVVKTKKGEIKVLGTKFNVSAYEEDGKDITTLAAGAVRVTSQDKKGGVRLRPGYEAVIKGNSDNIKVDKANIKTALAWKNGQFIFENEELGNIMRTLSRWYDVKVVYEEGVDSLLHFTGRIRKYENITDILEKLEKTHKIGFDVAGREVKVVWWKKKAMEHTNEN